MTGPGKKTGTGTGPVPKKRSLTPGTGQNGNALSREKLAIVLGICEKVAAGELIKDFLGPGRPKGWPTWRVFGQWQTEYPAIREMYRTARELSGQVMEDRALEIAQKLVTKGEEYTGTFVQGAGKAMEQFRWSAERRAPGDFGTKAATQTIVPIQINTTLDLGQPGGGSARDAGNPFSFTVERIVEAEAEEVAEPEAPTEPPDGWAQLAASLPPEAAKFGLKEWPKLRVPRDPGGPTKKPRLKNPKTGEPSGAERGASGTVKQANKSEYVRARKAEIEAERKAKGE
jgi:hypothetical protein